MGESVSERVTRKLHAAALRGRGRKERIAEALADAYAVLMERLDEPPRVERLNLVYTVKGLEEPAKNAPDLVEGGEVVLSPIALDGSKGAPVLERMPIYTLVFKVVFPEQLRLELRRGERSINEATGASVGTILEQLADDIVDTIVNKNPE